MAPHRQLFLSRDSQLADQEDIHWRVESPRDLERNRHTPPRQRQHQHVRAVGIRGEPGGQLPPGFITIPEWQPHHPLPDRYCWNHQAASRATSSSAPGSSKR